MLSNCILSMSTTSLPPPGFYTFILPSCILPTILSVSFHSFFFFFLFQPITPICLSAVPCLPFLSALCFSCLASCAWSQVIPLGYVCGIEKWKARCHTFSTWFKCARKQINVSLNSAVMSLFSSFSHRLSVWTHVALLSVWLVSIASYLSVEGQEGEKNDRDSPSFLQSRLARGEWTNE